MKNFEDYLKTLPERCVQIRKGDLMTFVKITGLKYLTDAMNVFKESEQCKEMRDIQFKGYSLIFAYAHA